MENFFGSRALKKLIGRGQGSDRAASEARKVAAKLWGSSMKGKCKAVSSSHAAKACTTTACRGRSSGSPQNFVQTVSLRD